MNDENNILYVENIPLYESEISIINQSWHFYSISMFGLSLVVLGMSGICAKGCRQECKKTEAKEKRKKFQRLKPKKIGDEDDVCNINKHINDSDNDDMDNNNQFNDNDTQTSHLLNHPKLLGHQNSDTYVSENQGENVRYAKLQSQIKH